MYVWWPVGKYQGVFINATTACFRSVKGLALDFWTLVVEARYECVLQRGFFWGLNGQLQDALALLQRLKDLNTLAIPENRRSSALPGWCATSHSWTGRTVPWLVGAWPVIPIVSTPCIITLTTLLRSSSWSSSSFLETHSTFQPLLYVCLSGTD